MSISLNKLQKPTPASTVSMRTCVIVGQSIYAITTATVLVSMGHIVDLYADEVGLQHTLTNYTFEHQQQALWELYISQNKLRVHEVPAYAAELFEYISKLEIDPSLLWFFYPELPDQWREGQGGASHWVEKLNNSQISAQLPVVVSGISTLGTYQRIAEHCKRPWVYYVPFVFMQDGRSYDSMLSPMLWLMGEKTPNSIDKVHVLQPFISQATKSVISDIATIEFSRSAIMSMLATRVSFMNEWSRLADHQKVDITEVASIMALDPRVGESYLKAGWGFGGHTLPTELSVLEETLTHTQVEHRLIQTVKDINDDQKELIFRKFWQYFEGMIEGKSVCIWGASYKSDSGRTSSSAIHPLLRLLWSYNITTYVYAAEAENELLGLYPDQLLLQFIDDPTEKLSDVDALFVMVWSDTRHLPIAAINQVVVPVFDAKNAFSKKHIQALVGDYRGIGRGKLE